MFITKPHKYHRYALRIYLAEDRNHKFSLNIWTNNCVWSHSCQKMLTWKLHLLRLSTKTYLLEDRWYYPPATETMNIYLYSTVKNKLWNEGEKSYEQHSPSKTTQDQSVCLPTLYSIKRAHVSIRKKDVVPGKAQKTPSLFNKTKLTKTAHGFFIIPTTPELTLFNLHCYLLINQRE